MKNKKGMSICECFSSLPDPRILKKTRHKLLDIITITICAVISGADSWVEIEAYGHCKYEWLKTFLKLPNGIPSHDTFGRFFSLVSTQALETCFLNWVQSVVEVVDEVIAIDGKQVRRSYDRASDKAAIHMVSAWASASGMVIGQVKTDEKSNEITAIPELLKVLELKGCIVTLDAMGCQKEIAKQIVTGEADYVLALKGNQGNLYKEVYQFFQDSLETNFEGLDWDYHKTEDTNHGRVEIRRYWTVSSLSALTELNDWPQMNLIGMVESERQNGDQKSLEFRFYISSLAGDAKQFAKAVRNHWGIENSLHWVLDVAFREDESRIRQGNAPENLAIIRHLALNLIKKEKSLKVGTKVKRMRAGWDNDYLLKILSG